MKPKKKKGVKEKKPDYRKTETFQDYKSAAATFSDYNPGTDTVFVGASIDPGMADRKAQHQANVSASKGASKANYNDTKMYRTKNEAGQDVYVSLRKYDKNEYSKGGKMKAKKYKKGGQVDPPKGKKLTKEMVDKQHSSDLDKSANTTNKLAKKASTGLKDNGFPMKKEAVKALAKNVEKRKKRESNSKPNYRDVGKPIPGGASPRFKKGGKMMKYLKGGQVKLDANKDGKITGQDFKMLKKK